MPTFVAFITYSSIAAQSIWVYNCIRKLRYLQQGRREEMTGSDVELVMNSPRRRYFIY